jgi:glycine betaine/proline transport system substrate-binding protein
VYLSGGDEFFGPNFGGATISTVARSGFAQGCPNLGRLFSQMTFTVSGEDEIMNAIDNGKQPGNEAAESYLRKHAEELRGWLEGVQTRDGRPGLPAVEAALGPRG